MGSINSTSQQILFYYVFQKKIENFFNGEKMKKDNKESKIGYFINPEWIKEWKRRRNYTNIKSNFLEAFNIGKTKLDNEQIKLIKDNIEQKDEKNLTSDENNNIIIKYSDFMVINEKIFTKIFLENFVNKKTFESMNLNKKNTFEEIKYIFKEEMIIFFLEKYSIIKILLSLAGSSSKIINITFSIFYVDTYNNLSKKFEKGSSEEIINYLIEIKVILEIYLLFKVIFSQL